MVTRNKAGRHTVGHAVEKARGAGGRGVKGKEDVQYFSVAGRWKWLRR